MASITIVTGCPGTGKTTLAARLAGARARGAVFLVLRGGAMIHVFIAVVSPPRVWFGFGAYLVWFEWRPLCASVGGVLIAAGWLVSWLAAYQSKLRLL